MDISQQEVEGIRDRIERLENSEATLSNLVMRIAQAESLDDIRVAAFETATELKLVPAEEAATA